MEAIHTNDTFEIKNDGELIVSSLFNFLCYYYLDEIQWTFQTFFDDLSTTSGKIAEPCLVTVNLRNDNTETSYSFRIERYVEQNWKSWIFRAFYLGIITISALKLALYSKEVKKEKKKKSMSNLSTHEFDFKVRLNSKRSIGDGGISDDSFTDKQ